MPVAKRMRDYAANSSFIRKMFEEGNRLAAIHGRENVYDFSLGNPDVAPPASVLESLNSHAASMNHGYMPNAGYADVRAKVAEYASRTYAVELTGGDILMTCGAGGALNVILKALLDEGSEVITIAPYFAEYRFYIENHGGKMVVVKAAADFLPDIAAIQAALTARTRAIIINSPNNPSGRVYPADTLKALAEIIKDRPDIVVIADEPYRRLVYDGVQVPSVLELIPNSLVATSASKELSLPGQRIGYIALSPALDAHDDLMGALILANRILGFVNAPALMQLVLADCIDDCVDVGIYAERRTAMCAVMDAAGLEYAEPEGAFYLFVKAPKGDDLGFCRALVEERILAVPGSGFGFPGYIRFAYCYDEKTIRAAAEGLKRAVAGF